MQSLLSSPMLAEGFMGLSTLNWIIIVALVVVLIVLLQVKKRQQ